MRTLLLPLVVLGAVPVLGQTTEIAPGVELPADAVVESRT